MGLELGADDYVVKPFSGAEVMRASARCCAVPSAVTRRWRRCGSVGWRSTVGAARGARRIKLDLSRKEFSLLVALASRAGRVVTRDDLMAEVWDENWFGSTKTLDVRIGWLRRKLGDDPADPRLPPHRPRSRLPLLRARGVPERLSLRRALLLAFAYVLLLAIVSFGIPLGLALRDRVDSEVRSQARSQADLVAATANDQLGPRDAEALAELALRSAEAVRGQVLIVDVRVVLADSAGAGQVGVSYARRPEIAVALSGRTYQEERTATRSTPTSAATAVPIVHNGHRAGLCGSRRTSTTWMRRCARLRSGWCYRGARAGDRVRGGHRDRAPAVESAARLARGHGAGDRRRRPGASRPWRARPEQRSLARSFNEMTGRLAGALRARRSSSPTHRISCARRSPSSSCGWRRRRRRSCLRTRCTRSTPRCARSTALSLTVDELLLLSRAGERTRRPSAST